MLTKIETETPGGEWTSHSSSSMATLAKCDSIVPLAPINAVRRRGDQLLILVANLYSIFETALAIVISLAYAKVGA